MRVLFLGKRYYTNRDALTERYGRIYQLPSLWHRAGVDVRLWLLDYRRGAADPGQPGGMGVLSTPVPGLSCLVAFLRSVLSSAQRPQLLVASGDCYIGLLGWLIARLSGARFVFDIYDRYDAFPGYWSPPGFDLLRFLRNRADACLFASEIVPDQLGGRRATDIVVPNGLDTERFRPLDKHACRQQMGLAAERYLVGYFGSMEPDRGVADLQAAVERLAAAGMPVKLLLAGRASDEVDVESAAVEYLGNRPFEQMPLLLGCCDVLALPYRRSTVMDAGASNKIAEYIAAGRPVAATRSPNLMANFEFDEAAAAGLADPSNPESLARAIESCLSTPSLLSLPEGMSWPDIASATWRKVLDALGGDETPLAETKEAPRD